jgi:hypothetical protein
VDITKLRPKLRTLLADSLTLWDVAGDVSAGQSNVVAEIRAANGAYVWIECAGDDTPFRWLARWRAAGEAPGAVRELRPRACSSLVGLLAAIREALDVDRGSAVRIVPAPADP